MLNYNEEFDKLRSKVLRFALYKKRTEKEIRDKFANENRDYIDEIIEFLIEDKYINDLEYIESYFIESKLLRNLSIKEIEYKLMEKGIDRSDIENHVNINEEDFKLYEINSAKKLLERRLDKKPEVNIKYLLNKGYKIDNIKEAIKHIDEEDE